MTQVVNKLTRKIMTMMSPSNMDKKYENLNILIFKNEQKKEEKHPDYRAKMKISNSFEDVGAGWVKVSAQKGTKFISLSLQVVPLRNALNELNTTSNGNPVPFPNKDEEML